MTQWFAVEVYEGYEWLEVDDDRWDHAFLDPAVDPRTFDGLRVRLLDRLGEYDLEPADCPWFGTHALALRPRTLAILEPLVGADGSFCAVSCPGTTIDVLAVRPANVLDEAASNVALDPHGVPTSFMGVVLRQDRLVDCNFVRLPYWASPVYVSQWVVDAYERAGLCGLRFDTVPTSG